MAKRIKVTGKPPRGLSKKERIVKGADARFKGESRYIKRNPSSEDWMDESTIETLAGERDYAAFSNAAKRGATRPSSTRKKRVKEGNRKFIGPRQLKSELAEDREAKVRSAEGFPFKYITRGPGRAGHIYEVDEGGILPFEASKQEIRKYDRLRKESNSSSKRRAREILERLFARYYGRGQEFDRQD